MSIENKLLLVAIVMLMVVITFQTPMAVTGDEIRYLYHSVSQWLAGTAKAPEQIWAPYAELHHQSGIPFSALVSSIHAPVHTVFMAYQAAELGVEHARAVQSILWIIAFLGSYYAARCLVRWPYALGASIIMAISLPFLSYARLLYAEIWLPAIFAWAIALGANASTKARYYGALLLALLLPFLHIRMALVAPFLFAWIIILNRPILSVSWKDRIRIALVPAIMGALIMLLFVAFQITMTGSIAGTASAPNSPSAIRFPERLAIQLVTVQHGLLIFNPLMLCSFAGLSIAAWRRKPHALAFVGMMLLYCIAFVWGTASESAPARFWVAMMPLFTVGLGYWLSVARHWSQWAVTAVLAYFSLVNSVLFLGRPNAFLENRGVSLTSDFLFGYPSIGTYVSHLLPTDWGFFAETEIYLTSNALKLAQVSSLFLVLFILLCLGLRKGKIGLAARIATLWSIGLLIAGLQYREMPAHVTFSGSAIDISFNDTQSPRILRFPAASPLWAPNYPARVKVSYLDPNGHMVMAGIVPAQQIMGLPPMPPTREVKIEASDGVFGAWSGSANVLGRPVWWPF